MTDIVERLRKPSPSLNEAELEKEEAADEIERLRVNNDVRKTRIKQLQAERDELFLAERLVISIVHTAGGKIEGQPTSSINILQRIRQLCALEDATIALVDRKAMTELREQSRIVANLRAEIEHWRNIAGQGIASEHKALTEIERLRATNADMLAALQDIAALSSVSYRAPHIARAAITKAEKT